MHKDVNIPYQQDSLNPPPSSLPRLPITALESIHPYVQPSASIIIPPFKNVPSDPSRKENQQHLPLRRRIRQNPFRFQPPPRFFQRPSLYPRYPHHMSQPSHHITSKTQTQTPKNPPFPLPYFAPKSRTHTTPSKTKGKENSRTIRLISISHHAHQQTAIHPIHPHPLPPFLFLLLTRRDAPEPAGRWVVVRG